MAYIYTHLTIALVAGTLYLWLICRNVCWPHLIGWLLCSIPVVNGVWACILACEAIGDLLRRRWL